MNPQSGPYFSVSRVQEKVLPAPVASMCMFLGSLLQETLLEQ